MGNENTREWALILGSSSGFGGTTALRLAQDGLNIFGVHLDRKQTMPDVEKVIESIRQAGREVVFFNINAADDRKRERVLDEIAGRLQEDGDGGFIKVLMHSLAFGALLPFVEAGESEQISRKQLEMTLDVMANSLVYWTQGLANRNLFKDKQTRIFAMTSAGGRKVWPAYGAVSAAKAALEAHIRQLALEFAPKGIAANAIRAGATDTPALRKIPGNKEMLKLAGERNPGGRITCPQDVAAAISTLTKEERGWMTGNVIGVDAGEFNAN